VARGDERTLSLSGLGALPTEADPEAFRGSLETFDWTPGDRLALVTGFHPDVVSTALVAKALAMDDDATTLSMRLYEALLASARAAFAADQSLRSCSDPALLRNSVVVVARAR